MFQVFDIFEEAKKISGICDEQKIFRWLTDAVSITANKADLEGWKGYLDICTSTCGNFVTLPREVGTVYGVNIGGHPTLGLGELFNFHLNGPGDCHDTCRWSWQDLGAWHPTYRDLITPAKLVAYVQRPEDAGKKLVVYGYDINGLPLTTVTSAGQTPGYQVPTIYSYALPDTIAPTVARITGVVKDNTIGVLRLSTIDDSGPQGVLLGVYEPDERTPQYRRIKLHRRCNWVRIAYRKSNPTLTSLYDRIPFNSRIGFLLGMRAVKFYSEGDLPNAHGFEADAARLEIEAQQALDGPTYTPPQVIDGEQGLRDKCDYDIR